MYIEFTGASGAGKSVLCLRVIALLRERGARITSNHERDFGFARMTHPTLQNLYLDMLALRSLMATGKLMAEGRFAWGITRGHGMPLPYRLNAVRSYLRKRGLFEQSTKYDTVIMDEGIIHGLHNLLVHMNTPINTQAIDAYLRHVPLPDRIVLVDAPADVLASRILARSDQPIRNRDPNALRAYADKAWTLYQILKTHPALTGRMLIVDATQAQNTVPDTLMDFVIGGRA